MDLLDRLPGQILDGKYRIDKKLGQGGMGAVYLAVHLGTARPVALKVITPQFMENEEFVSRFKREAKAAGLLRHPNIVNVTDFGFASAGADSLAYLVMEYLDGCPLSDVLKEEKQLQLNWVIDIIEQVCLAIDKAHKYGIVHRDLKPDNIWLEPNERGGYRVKVLDFGLAKVIDAPQEETPHSDSEITLSLDTGVQRAIKPPSAGKAQTSAPAGEKKTQVIDAKTLASLDADEIVKTEVAGKGRTKETAGLTQAGAILGTPVYMSPEQCLGGKLDARSDIYSLGVIAYEMLAGQPPFKGNLYTLMAQHIQAEPPRLKEHRPDIRRSAEELLMSTLAKKPEDRPASAAAFAHALRARAEGTGTILHRAFNFYSVNFPVFFRLAFIANIPLIAAVFLSIVTRVIEAAAPSTAPVLEAIDGVAQATGETVSWLISVGLFVPVVAQLTIAPLRPVQTGPVLKAFRKRIKPFIAATLLFEAILMLLILYEDFAGGLMGGVFKDTSLTSKLLKPFLNAEASALMDNMTLRAIITVALAVPALLALRAILNYILYAPVIVMEDCSARESFSRSKDLTRGAIGTVIGVLSVFILARIIDGALSTFIEGYIVEKQTHLAGAILAGTFSRSLIVMLDILIDPLIVVSLALLYFKTRQSRGETMRDIMGDYQEEEMPATRWQERMMKRLSVRISRASKT
jgi:serine/threonine protein kinase